jgi:hypothetical protein
MASFNFNSMVRAVPTGSIDFDTDSFKMLLVTSALDETAKDTFDFRNDIVNEVANGNGYATGGNAVTLTVAAVDTANNDVEITASAVSWAASTIAAAGAVIYKSRGGASSADEVICFLDFGATISSTSGTFTVTPTASIKFQN